MVRHRRISDRTNLERPVDLSIIVISYNVRSYLAKCLGSLPDACTGLIWESFVVDNASHDGSAALVAAEFPSVRLVVNRENVGFARAVNGALPLTRGRYVLLFNPDAAAPPRTLHRLVSIADRWPLAGLFSPAHRKPATNEIRRPLQAFPTWRSVFHKYTLVRWVLPSPMRPATWWREEVGRPTTAGWFGGAALLIRREMLDTIGGLDERFFMWCEDTEYCRRAIRRGWSLFYAADVVIDHHGSRSVVQEQLGWVMFRAMESLLLFLGADGRRAAPLLKALFKLCLLATLLGRVAEHATKFAAYRLFGRASRAERHRRRLAQVTDFLQHFAARFLRS